ncbi:hypothetical protein [Oceanobacillus kimchii]|uniref:hypothetical protein n=1 Tax=Oceanobacillus kimchii TaxID=746691 RepID=UPI003B02A0D9
MGNKSSFQQGMILAFSAYLLWGFLQSIGNKLTQLKQELFLHTVLFGVVYL